MSGMESILSEEVIDASVKVIRKGNSKQIIKGSYQVVRRGKEVVYIAKYTKDIEAALLDENSNLSKVKASISEEGEVIKVSREFLSGYVIKESGGEI